MSEHGTNRQYRAGCRCAECRAASAKYRRELDAAHRRGERFRTDPGEALRHVNALRSQGVALENIADAAGLSRVCLQDLTAGRTRYVHSSTHNAILGVTLDDRGTVPGWKVRMLVAHIERSGVDTGAIAKALRVHPDTVQRLLASRTNPRRTFNRIVTVYRYLARSGTVPASVLDEVGA